MLRNIKNWFKNLFKKPVYIPPSRSVPRDINEAGLNLIKKFEGFYPNAYKDPVGVWTIGYGTTAYPPDGQRVKSGDKITYDQAIELLRHDVEYMAEYINGFLVSNSIEMNDNEFSALVSLCYNLGGGVLTQSHRSLHKAVMSKDRNEITKAMMLYVKGGGKVLPGLVKRRQAEVELFLK